MPGVSIKAVVRFPSSDVNKIVVLQLKNEGIISEIRSMFIERPLVELH